MKCFMSEKECDSVKNRDQPQVFMISPFGYPFDDIYKEGITKVLRDIRCHEINPNIPPGPKLDVFRADQAPQLGFVMCKKICQQIQESEFIIADISKPNPNVFYELGLSYGLKKKIILIGQKRYGDALTFGLANEVSYIQYQSFNDFQSKNLFINAFREPIKNSTEIPAMPDSTIFNIINKNTTIEGLHIRALNQSIAELVANGELGANNKLNDQWQIVSQSISNQSTIKEMMESLKNCKICTIDTSIYGTGESDINPYIFFCLGLGHGLEKEVIPLTYKSQETSLPFDIRGLWHIFYKDLDQLKNQFKSILPKIHTNYKIEKDNHLYKKIWTPFLVDEKVHIMTYGRSHKGVRGIRTDIDKWDYITVSELTHYFALKFSKNKVTIEAPRSKLDLNEVNSKRNNIENELKNKNCIIIGAPDVSDFTEIVLSRLLNIRPYVTERQQFKGYVINKDHHGINLRSSFHWRKLDEEKEGIYRNNPKPESVIHFDNSYDNGVIGIYGILTIADNPFVEHGPKKKIMIFSGFSGIATYGIAKLLTDEAYRDELSRLDDQYDKQKINRDTNVQILIRITFSHREEKDDNRELRGVSFVEMISIGDGGGG